MRIGAAWSSVIFALALASGCGGDDGGGSGTGGSGGSAGTSSGEGGASGQAGASGASGSGATSGGGAGGTSGGGAGGTGGSGGGGAGGAGGTGGTPSGDPIALAQVAAKADAACGVTADGKLACWGDNTNGGLVGEPAADTTAPKWIDEATDWAEVTLGSQHACVRKSSGEIACWGSDLTGALGSSATQGVGSNFPPVAIDVAGPWQHVSAEQEHSCAIHMDGTLYCWGKIEVGEAVHAPTQVGTDNDWIALATGGQHACAIKASGALYCWGSNYKGQLGQGGELPTSTNGVLQAEAPLQVGTDTDWVEVACGDKHACARKESGAIFCFGENLEGQIGDSSFDPRTSPTQATADTDWAEVKASGASTCARKQDSTLWCWGKVADHFRPLTSTSLEPVKISTESGWTSLAVGGAIVCAIRDNAETVCWGSNQSGQLGDGTTDLHQDGVTVLAPAP